MPRFQRTLAFLLLAPLLLLAGCETDAPLTSTPIPAPTAPAPTAPPPSPTAPPVAPPATSTPAPAPTATAPAGQAPLNGFQAGISVPVWWTDGYSSTACDAAWPAIAALGANWVAIVPTWYQAGGAASTIAAEAGGRSASDASVRHAIKAAHAAGLRVLLKPHVDSVDDAWRGTFRPLDPLAWFASYTGFITSWATVAQQEGADLFAVGTELLALSGSDHHADWTRVVAAVRAVYHGPLTYAANWGKQPRDSEYQHIDWWDQLDYIGIDAYFPLSGKPTPTAADLQAGWDSYTDPWGGTYHWKAAITAVQARWQRPVLFTEVGYSGTLYGGASWDAPTALPGPTPRPLPVPATEAVAYQALLAAWGDVPWFAGFYAWQWSPNLTTGGPADASMLINGKSPVLEALRVGFAALRR